MITSSSAAAIAQRLCGITMMRLTLSRWTPAMQPASAEVVTRPPGVRMILASPKVRPTISKGTIRESMQVIDQDPRMGYPVETVLIKAARRTSCCWPAGRRRRRSVCVTLLAAGLRLRAPCVSASTCRVAQPAAADPIAAMGWLLGVPDPSRRASAAGSGTGLPLGAAAMAGAGPAQASSSSILALEEPMAAYPAGRPALGRIVLETGDLDRAGVGSRAGRATYQRPSRPPPPLPTRPRSRSTLRADAELDAGHAAARPALWSYGRRGKCSSWASLVMKTSSASLQWSARPRQPPGRRPRGGSRPTSPCRAPRD